MTTQTLVLIVIGLAVFALATLIVLNLLRGDSSSGLGNAKGLRGDLAEFRQEVEFRSDEEDSESFASIQQSGDWQNSVEAEPERKKADGLKMRLRYANLAWMPPYVVSLLQILISLVAFAVAYVYLRLMLQLVAACMGPLIVNWWINKRINKRVQRFDKDFAPFLMSVVGMLKTGLNPIQALEAASESLEDGSLVKQEVELMLERVRVGIPEDRSIGSFAEDINQPEVELFVQALLLSRRVGGTLSDTLDRIAKQVRKRQIFKRAANGAVSMQRGSIFAIVVVIALVQLYMLLIAPDMVIGAWTNPKLAGYAQGALVVVFAAMFVINRLTRIRI